MRAFCLVKSLIFKTPKISKMPVKGLYGNQEFNASFWPMIFMALQFTFNAIVSFRSEF